MLFSNAATMRHFPCPDESGAQENCESLRSLPEEGMAGGCSESFAAPNFEVSEYAAGTGQPLAVFKLSR